MVRRLLFDPDPEVFDGLEEAVFSAILQTRQLLHVHSERIYLMGCGEGAAVAYWLGLTYPERFAGIVAINGWLPVGLRPLGRLQSVSRPADPGRARRVEHQGTSSTKLAATSRPFGPAGSASRSSPIPAPIA